MHAPLFCLLLTMLLLAAPGMGAEVFVAPSGDDGNPGTLDKPFRTIGKAAGVMQAG